MRRQRPDDRGRAGGAVSPVRFRRAEKSLRRDFAHRRPRFAEPESSFAEGSDTAARIGRRHPNPLFVPSFGTFFSGEVPDSRNFFLSLQANCGGTKNIINNESLRNYRQGRGDRQQCLSLEPQDQAQIQPEFENQALLVGGGRPVDHVEGVRCRHENNQQEGACSSFARSCRGKVRLLKTVK